MVERRRERKGGKEEKKRRGTRNTESKGVRNER